MPPLMSASTGFCRFPGSRRRAPPNPKDPHRSQIYLHLLKRHPPQPHDQHRQLPQPHKQQQRMRQTKNLQVCAGCEKVLCVLLHGIAWVYSHTLHTCRCAQPYTRCTFRPPTHIDHTNYHKSTGTCPRIGTTRASCQSHGARRWSHIPRYIYIYICVCICTCMCIYLCTYIYIYNHPCQFAKSLCSAAGSTVAHPKVYIYMCV